MAEHVLVLSKLSCRFQVVRIYFVDNLLSFGIRLPFVLSVCQVLSLEAYLPMDMQGIIGVTVEDHCSAQIAHVFHLRKLDLVLRINPCFIIHL